MTALRGARVGRLATVRPDGQPHIVPCCFALVGDTVVTAVDAKPKSTTALQRLANIDVNPRASLLVDHYDDDWAQLWWVRVDGIAAMLGDGDGAERDRAIDALAAKYEQYRTTRPTGPVIVLRVERWRWWSSQ